MELLKNPIVFNEFLKSLNLPNNIYAAMNRDDFPEVVLCVSKSLEDSSKLPLLKMDRKSASKSDNWRREGNIAFKEKDYHLAQECYNKALLMAPTDSEALVLAYSNRSVLLYEVGSFQACLNDINTCLKLNCPQRIIGKLNERKNKAGPRALAEKISNTFKKRGFLQEYISVKNKNADIPCATADIRAEVDDSNLPKLIATNYIKVGKILAVEKAFVSVLDPSELSTSCHYCHKINLNLIPCDSCCVALFCNETCKTACMNDYHSTECKIIDIFGILESQLQLGLKAAIKVKNQFKSWDKLFKESLNVGWKRIKQSKINEIYDGQNILSMLNFKDNNIFIYGQFHNMIYECALIIYYLVQTKSFFPLNNDENRAAISGFCRLLIYFSLHMTRTMLNDHVSSPLTEITYINENKNIGVFPLLGKIKHSCNPNVLLISLNNKAILVAIQPLEAGTELCISYLGHRLENEMDSKVWKFHLFTRENIVCEIDCTVCNGQQSEQILKEKHKRVLAGLEDVDVRAFFDCDYFRAGFSRCSKALSIMSDVPDSEEYRRVFSSFRRYLLFLQEVHCSNWALRMPK